MAVPSSIMPLRTVPRILSSEALSVVSGLCVKLSPAKTTKPIRSFGRSAMKLAATSLAAEIRSGWKSRASMLPEMSSDSTMSIPSVVRLESLWELCGRASATTNSATAPQRNTKGICLR